MKIIKCLVLLIVFAFSSHVLFAQNYVKSVDGTVMFTITNTDKIYFSGESLPEFYMGKLVGDQLFLKDIGAIETGFYDDDFVFKKEVLYVNDQPVLKTVGGKTYIYGEQFELVFERKGNKVYSFDGDMVCSFSKAPSDNMQTAIVFILMAVGTNATEE